jgi:hypothetical protein
LLDFKPVFSAETSDRSLYSDQEGEFVLAGGYGNSNTEITFWHSSAWKAAWDSLGFPSIDNVVNHPSSMEAVMLQRKMSTFRNVASRHWELERSGVCLAIIETIHHHVDKDCTLELQDPSGSSHAYLHARVIEDAGPDLSAGAVLLLSNPAIVHNRREVGRWALNITPDNVGMLWPARTKYFRSHQQVSGGFSPSEFATVTSELESESVGSSEGKQEPPVRVGAAGLLGSPAMPRHSVPFLPEVSQPVQGFDSVEHRDRAPPAVTEVERLSNSSKSARVFPSKPGLCLIETIRRTF